MSAAQPRRSRGVTLFAALLIATPFVQWAYVSALSYFTILEPPFTGSRGIPLAMQLFFAPGNIIGVILGVGLLFRSEWTRRIARVVFLIAVMLTAWYIGLQVATSRLDSNALLGALSLAVTGACLWYFGLGTVRDEFRPREARSATVAAAPLKRPEAYPPSMIVAACAECMLGLVAAILIANLYTGFDTQPLLDVGPGIGVTEADEFLRKILFVAFALFLAPHVFTTAASVGILLGRDTSGIARRQALIACWTVIGAALVAAWLATREGLAFDARSVKLIYAFCGLSLVWHACFLYILARFRSSQ
jgi:hypothetical protein